MNHWLPEIPTDAKPADVMDTVGCNSNKMFGGEADHLFPTISILDALFPRLRGVTVTEKSDKDTVNQLIAEKRYEEAKTLLRQSSDPAARAWLAKLEQTFPTPGLKRPTSSYKFSGSGATSSNTSTASGCWTTLSVIGGLISTIITCATATPETRTWTVGVVVVILFIVGLFWLFSKQSD